MVVSVIIILVIACAAEEAWVASKVNDHRAYWDNLLAQASAQKMSLRSVVTAAGPRVGTFYDANSKAPGEAVIYDSYQPKALLESWEIVVTVSVDNRGYVTGGRAVSRVHSF